VLLVLVGLGLAGAYVLYQTYQPAQPVDPLAEDYQQALNYMDQGQWDQAVSLFDQILDAVPGYEDAARKKAEALEKQKLTHLYDQGKTYFEQGKWDEAIAQWQELRERDPGFNEASVEDMLCRAHLENGLLRVAAFDEDGDLRHLHEAMV
jgi:tetratricopeptide (TPR) repeat protein